MNVILRTIIAAVTLTSLSAINLGAQELTIKHPSIRIVGRKTITVNQGTIYLSDLADVSSALIKDDESIIALKKIDIDPSPSPGKELTLPAARVLERLQQKGVALADVTYVLPRVLTVTRASRTASTAEIEGAVKDAIKNLNREVTIRTINYDGSMHVSPQVEHFRAEPFITGKSGQMGFTIHSITANSEDSKFDITAQIDEWAQIPIARRQIPKGSKVSSDDVMMAKLNLAALPSDAFQHFDDVVGQEVNNEISYGEAFRKGKLSQPILVPAGAHVVMVYRSGALEATATGTALESGALGDEVKVRNDNSKKTVSGKVIETGIIGVSQ